MNTVPYVRRANYYETDQMGVVHHSNYIRWFEEARIDFFRQHGIDYREMENQGIIIPVVDVQCTYKRSVRFDDWMEIHLVMDQYNGVRMCFRYEVRFQKDGALAATGHSTHCFIGKYGKPFALQRVDKTLHAKIKQLSEE